MSFFVFQVKILTSSQMVREFWRILRTENRTAAKTGERNRTEPNFWFGSVSSGSLHQFWTELQQHYLYLNNICDRTTRHTHTCNSYYYTYQYRTHLMTTHNNSSMIQFYLYLEIISKKGNFGFER